MMKEAESVQAVVEGATQAAGEAEAKRNRNWELFYLKDWFEIKSAGKAIKQADLGSMYEWRGKGLIPYVTRKESRNGVFCYTTPHYRSQKNRRTHQYEDVKTAPHKGNCVITGVQSHSAYYQAEDFYNGGGVNVVTCSRMNLYLGLFIVAALRKAFIGKGYTYGNGPTKKNLERVAVMLPAKESEGKKEPDWDYMEATIKEKYQICIDCVSDIVTEEMDKLTIPDVSEAA